jgi:hypothetical protein
MFLPCLPGCKRLTSWNFQEGSRFSTKDILFEMSVNYPSAKPTGTRYLGVYAPCDGVLAKILFDSRSWMPIAVITDIGDDLTTLKMPGCKVLAYYRPEHEVVTTLMREIGGVPFDAENGWLQTQVVWSHDPDESTAETDSGYPGWTHRTRGQDPCTCNGCNGCERLLSETGWGGIVNGSQFSD